MALSTYLSQIHITSAIVAIIASVLATAFWLLKRSRYRNRRYAIKVTAMHHQVTSHVDLLHEELHMCIAREQHNEPMRCFGGPESSDKMRINEIRELLTGRGSK